MKALFLFIILAVPAMADQSAAQMTAEETNSMGDNSEKSDNRQPASEKEAKSNISDQDFKPEQEISEDYPISLPSDI